MYDPEFPINPTGLVTPRVNINGTSFAELFKQITTIMSCIRAAEKAYAEATPHNRDFQTFEDCEERGAAARGAWNTRRQMLKVMHHELEELALRLQEQERGSRFNAQVEPEPLPTTPEDVMRAELAQHIHQQAQPTHKSKDSPWSNHPGIV